MIDDLYQDGTDQVLNDLVARPKPEPKPAGPGAFSGLASSIAGQARAGSARAIAGAADVLGAFGQVAGAYPEALGVNPTPEQKTQADAARKTLLASGPNYTSETGQAFRDTAASWMPDPKATGWAANIVGGLFGFGTELATGGLFAGPLAPAALGVTTGLDEADKLKAEGVDLATRTKAGLVVGAGNAAMVAAPMGAATRLGALAKGAVVGEGTMIGQTAAVQTILRHDGYDKISSQYDPFDPALLAMGALPGFLGALVHGGARAPTKLSDVVMSIESGGSRYGKDGQLLTSPKGAQGEMQVMPGTSKDPGFGVAPAKDGSPEELARVGRDYLDAMVKRYEGDTDKAMAAYNAGPGALDAAVKAHPGEWLSHLPAETQAYVAKGRAKLGDTAFASAVRSNPDAVRAARVTQAADAVDATRLTHDTDLAGANEHDAAMARAHEQISNGDRVDVTDIVNPERFDPVKVQEAVARMGEALDEHPAIRSLPEEQRPVLRQMYEDAAKEKPGFDSQLQDIADQFGGRPRTAALKGADRAVEKIQGDYAGDPTKIKDLLRGTLNFDNIEAAQRAVGEIFGRFDVLPAGRRNLLTPGTESIGGGYRDAKFNVRMPNGHVAEVQVNIASMLKAKKEAHPLYKESEKLRREIDAAPLSDANAPQRARIGELETQMRAIYEPAWAEATNLRNSSGEIGLPLRSAELEGKGLGGATSQAEQTGASLTADHETGMPSTSQNRAPASNLAGSREATLDMGTTSQAPILPLKAQGNETTATTERGTKIAARWSLVEASDLVTSHDNALEKNPAYPPELQPRDRSRAASEQQVASMANAIRPELLGESPKASDGAPIVGKDGVVESGNARTIALRRAYETGKADAYRAWLEQHAEKFGLKAGDVAGIREPVLVRVAEGERDRASFAREANESSVAAMSQTEQAKTDAARLPDLQTLKANEDGTLNIAGSADFVRGFMQKAVSPAERGSMMTATGELSQQGLKRIRDAVFAKAYDDADLVAMLTESTDANVKNVLAGLLRAAPDVAKLRDLMEAGARPQTDIAGPLVEAVRKFSQLREDGMTVDQFLAQRSMFDTGVKPETEQILKALQADSRSPKRVAEMVGRMTEAVDAMGDPRQQGMFGDAPDAKAVIAQTAQESIMQGRLDELAAKNPDMQVALPDGEKTTLASALAAVDSAFKEGSESAKLAQVAAECFLQAA